MKQFAPLTLLLLLTISLSACGNTVEPNPPVTNTPTVVQDGYTGLSIKDARMNALEQDTMFRVVMEDGEPQMVTMDFLPGRINATVQDGIVVSYEVEGSDLPLVEEPETERYNSESWKSIIPETCTSYFDGCNNCSRTAGIEVSACTKKACQQYQRPTCLEEIVIDEPIPKIRSVDYICNNDKKFTIYYGEYNAKTISANDIILVGSQEHLLSKIASDDGETYRSEQGLLFIDNGLHVELLKDDVVLYAKCTAS